jgi:hypothetical protein
MMKAGRELDALIAEKVMGLCTGKTGYVSEAKLTAQYRIAVHDDYVKNYREEPNADWLESEVEDRVRETVGGDYPPKECGKCEYGPHRTMKSYSTDIAAAWEVVEQFRRGWNGQAAACIDMHVSDYVSMPDCHCIIYGPSITRIHAEAETMPLAICLAALRAVGEQA